MSYLSDDKEFEDLFTDLEEAGIVDEDDKLIARHFFTIGYLRGDTAHWRRRVDMAINHADNILKKLRTA